MTDRPIIFSAPMVRALIREAERTGTGKTQTRRVIEPEPDGSSPREGSTIVTSGGGFVRQVAGHFRPKWRVGDSLWVKEATHRNPDAWAYEADNTPVAWPGRRSLATWTRERGAAMFLPRVASRLTLHVTAVRVERLQDMSADDAIAEGAYRSPEGEWTMGGKMMWPGTRPDCPIHAFKELWCELHGPNGWHDNPWVAAISFRPVLANVDSATSTDA